jgi:signal transduction histidine kinase
MRAPADGPGGQEVPVASPCGAVDEAGGRWRRKAFLIFAAWTLVGIGVLAQQAAQAATQGLPPLDGRRCARTMQDVWVWAAYTPFIFWLAARFPLEGACWRRRLPVHAAAALGSAGLDALLGWRVHPFLGSVSARPSLLAYFTGGATLSIYSYLAVLALGHALRYHRLWLEKQVRSAELERQLAQTRLGALEAQLRPHFLFNALHTVGSLVREGDQQGAIRTIAGLGDLLRLTLREGGQEVTLREELDLARRYLAIESTRHRERLTTHIDAQSGALDALVPRFLLQPLVENAVRHGIERVAGPGRVEVKAGCAGGLLRLEVRDTGPGPNGTEGEGLGLGLRNTRARLAHLYGDAQRLDLTAAPGGGTRVAIELPFRSAAHPVAAA